MDQQRDKDHPANAVTLPKVLLVDDEASILHSLRRLLRKKFEITTTVVPEDALRHLEEDDYAVLLQVAEGLSNKHPKRNGPILSWLARASRRLKRTMWWLLHCGSAGATWCPSKRLCLLP